jgi:hypothetical protein
VNRFFAVHIFDRKNEKEISSIKNGGLERLERNTSVWND